MLDRDDKPLDTAAQSKIVDRLLADLPYAGPRPHPQAREATQGTTPRRQSTVGTRRSAHFQRDTRRYPESNTTGVWARVALGVVLGIAVTFWPYRACGFPLVGYFGATATVIVAAIWGAASSWKHRAPTAHVFAILLLFWGMALTIDQVLQRTGYASTLTSWGCG